MEIINLNLTEGTLTLELSSNEYSKIYLDTIDNKHNIYSEKDELHSLVINNEIIEEDPVEPENPVDPDQPIDPEEPTDPEEPGDGPEQEDPEVTPEGGEDEQDQSAVTPVNENIEETPTANVIEVKNLSDAIYIVTVVSETNIVSIAIDEKALYLSKVNLLTMFCDTCLDKHQKEKIVLCDFKSQLLEYALANNIIDDAIDLCYGISKLLGLKKSYSNCRASRISNCSICKNGYCQLC